MTSIPRRRVPLTSTRLTAAAGWIAAAFGAVHVVVAPFERRAAFSQVAAEGWWDAFTLEEASTEAEVRRSQLFWVTLGSFGAPMLVLGSSVVWSARQQHRVPGWLGWTLLGWGAPMVTALPRSPSWVVPLVGALIVLGDRQRSAAPVGGPGPGGS